jgi:hypothetical protein
LFQFLVYSTGSFSNLFLLKKLRVYVEVEWVKNGFTLFLTLYRRTPRPTDDRREGGDRKTHYLEVGTMETVDLENSRKTKTRETISTDLIGTMKTFR